jgi:hypothetical protein
VSHTQARIERLEQMLQKASVEAYRYKKIWEELDAIVPMDELRVLLPLAARGERIACYKGHLYTKENTMKRKDGWRECRKCRAIKSSEQAARAKKERHSGAGG